MDFDPSSIPIPSAPNPPQPPSSGSSSDQQSAWANAAAALQRVAPPPLPPSGPPAPPPYAAPFPWLQQQYGVGLAAASGYHQQQQQPQMAFGGSWNPNGLAKPQNAGWNGQNQLNQQRPQWQQQQPQQKQPWQQQQQQQQWNRPVQQMQPMQQQPGAFKGFGLKQSMAGRLPHLQNSFVKQGGGPADMGGQVCDKAPQFGAVPANVRSYMERSLAAAPAADHQKVTAYLEARLRPLLQSGTASFVNWDKEPLPHTKNYELSKTWTPSAKNADKANPNSSPEKKPGFSWAGPPKGAENRRRRREESPEEDDDRREKRGWYEDREKRSPSVECTGEIKYLTKKEQQKLLKKEKAGAAKKEKAIGKKKDKKLHFDYVDPQEDSRKRDRMRRFAQDVIVAAPAMPYRPSRSHIVVGTSREVEKKYFRLTAAPDPTTVRPLEVLHKSLELMKLKYKEKVEYRYLCDQLRSIRQDLTVQRIRNTFTVEVYEIHARIALENKDREEFNKCQSQLKVLYEEIEGCRNEPEFTAYRLLYSVAMGNNTDVSTLLRGLSPAMKQEPCVAFALRVRNKLTMGDQVGFFKLYDSAAPLMCPYLLDMFVDRERVVAINNFVKAYRPSLSVATVARWLAMDEDEFVDWMAEKKFARLKVGGELDCKTLSGTVMA